MKQELIKKLAAFAPTEMPVLSVYLDLRPEATGGNPAVRSGEIVLKNRLHEIEKTYLPRGADLDSFRADREKIEEFIENKMSKATSGLIIFACSAANLWEVEEVGAELENEVVVGATPALFQLAKLLGGYETAVIAVVDKQTARFFVTNYEKLDETDAPHDQTVIDHRKTSGGGLNQQKFQRIVENRREEFSKEIASDLEKLIEKVGAKNLIIAGGENAVSHLQNNLSPHSKEILSSEILRLDEKAPRLEIQENVRGILEQIEKDRDQTNIEKLIGAMRGDGLAVAGINATAQALKNGQVEILLIDPQAKFLDSDTRNQMIRLAETSGAMVEMIENNEKFAAMQGIGGLLRYKLDGEYTANDIDSKFSLDSNNPLINMPENETEAALVAAK